MVMCWQANGKEAWGILREERWEQRPPPAPKAAMQPPAAVCRVR